MNEIIESQRGEMNRALAGDKQLRRDQQLLHDQLLEQNRELRVMTTPQKTRFRIVNLYKEFAYRSEIE